jgi:uncharacterized membrane protein YhaH (DUF805 family)
MLKVYFGEWGSGRLKRLPYLGYYVLLMVIMMAIVLGGIASIGFAEMKSGIDIAATQAVLVEKFGVVFVFGAIFLVITMVIAQLNILAKRIRDMGLPAMWTILGIIAVSMVLNILFPAQVTTISTAVVQSAKGVSAAAEATTTPSMIVQGFDMLVFLCLLFIPSDAFRK